MQSPDSNKKKIIVEEKTVVERDANRDPISGTPGAHPVGAGAGALGGGAAGAAIGTAVGGPVGGVAGAVIGGVAGGLAGKGVAESVNPSVEQTYWQENYEARPYYDSRMNYDDYGPAYRYGWETYPQYRREGRRFDDAERDLERGWERAKGRSRLEWERAKSATRDAWDRLERAMPGDADGDGR